MFFTALNFGQVAESDILTPSKNELELLDEINFVRTRPTDYESYVMSYSVLYRLIIGDEGIAAAEELRSVLKSMQPLDRIKWSPTLFSDAVTHGEKLKKSDQFKSSGYQWKEIITCGNLEYARLALIDLLIDAEDANRANRNMILQADLTEFGCSSYEYGTTDCTFLFVLEFN